MSEIKNDINETYFGIDSQIIGFWLSIMGTFLGLFLHIAPIKQFIKIYKKEESHKTIPEMVLILNTLCAISWFVYWSRLGYFVPCLSSFINIIIFLIFCIIYLYYYVGEKIFSFIIAVFIYYLTIFEYYYLCKYIFSIAVVGNLAMISNIIQFFFPCSYILIVLKTGNIKLIILSFSLIGVLCSSLWLFYGFIIKNINLIITNVIGLCLSIIQIIVYYYFYCKFGEKINDNDYEEKSEELEEKN